MVEPQFMINGVQCTLFFGENTDGTETLNESVSSDGPSASVMLKCPWLQRYKLVQGLMGGVTSTGSGSNTRISHILPWPYPTSQNLFCTQIGPITGLKPRLDIDGSQTGLKGWLYFDWAVLPATFSRPTWQGAQNNSDPSGLVFTTTKFKCQSEIFSPPGDTYYFIGGDHDGEPIQDSSVGFVRSHVEISMTRHLMPNPALFTILDTQGSVNIAPVQFADYEFPEGCLLFLGANTEPRADSSTGATTWDIEFSFLGNQNISWNEVMDPDGQYVLVNSEKDGSGDPPFESVDFSALFGTSLY